MQNFTITLTYKGRTLALSRSNIIVALVIFTIAILLIISSSLYFFTKFQEVEKLKKQLMVERTVNLTLAKEINESSNELAKIAQSITGKKSHKMLQDKHISSKIQIYGILNAIHNNLLIIDNHFSKSVLKFRGVINVAKLHNSTEILKGINITQVAKSISSKQNPSNIQKASNKYTAFKIAINESIKNISIKQKGLQILQEYILAMPLGTPVANGRFVSGFGTRHHPIYHKQKMHYGVDFVGNYGAKILATGDGVVEKALYSPGYGNYVILRHKHNVKTLYAHMSSIKVKRGQKIKTGATLGVQGSTGRSTGAHIHYEIIVDNKHIDPLNFIRAKSLL